jgi:hypothetical protein
MDLALFGFLIWSHEDFGVSLSVRVISLSH